MATVSLEYIMLTFVNHSAELGGAELFLLDIVKNIKTECNVITFEDGPLRQRMERAGVSTTVLDGGDVRSIRKGSSVLQAMRVIPSMLRLALRLRKIFRSSNVIYANTQKSFILSAIANIMSRVPLIWHLHDILDESHFRRGLIKVSVFLSNIGATCVIANSLASESSYLKAGGKAPTRVVYNGFDVERFSPKPTDCGEETIFRKKDAKSVNVGVFGRISEWKGQGIVIQSIEKILEVNLFIVGSALFEDKYYELMLRDLTESLDISSRVHFIGFREDVGFVMRQMDIIVHSSTKPEAFGRVIAEALLSGKPTIAAKSGGVAEIISDGRSGILCQPGNIDDLSSKIKLLVDNKDLRIQIGAQGRAEAMRRFTLDETLRGINSVLNDYAIA